MKTRTTPQAISRKPSALRGIARSLSLLLLLFLCLTLQAATPPLRILPLGDSITHGDSSPSPVPGGYRWPLYQKLAAAGYTVNYLGLQTSNPAPGQTETHHEGHPGWKIDQIDGIIESVFFQTADPDVVLLLLGANDFLKNVAPLDAVYRLDALMWKITQSRPNCILVVASLTPQNNSNNTSIVNNFNALLPGLVANHAAAGQKVYFTDMYSSVPLSGISADGVHPNSTGYGLMATNWYNAVLNAIPLEVPTASTTNPPQVWHVTVQPDLSGIVITYTKPVADSAADLSHYAPSGGFSISNAALDSGTNYSVTLTTSPLAPNTVYSVTINNVVDRTANSTPIAANTVVTFRTPAAAWTQDLGGSWNSAANWDSGIVPNGAGLRAQLTNAITANRAITLDSSITLGELTLGALSGTSAYTLSGSNSLVFNNLGNGALLTKTGTAVDVLAAPIVLQDDLYLMSGHYTFSGKISESGTARILYSSSDVDLSGSNSYTGGTQVIGGTLSPKNNSAFGTGDVVVYRGAELALPSAVTIPNDVSVGGAGTDGGAFYLWNAKSATRTFTGTVTLTAPVTCCAANSTGMNLKFAGPVNLGAYTFTLYRPTGSAQQDWSITGPVTGSGGITFNFAASPASSLTLSGSNTFTGTMLMSGSASLKLGNINALRGCLLDTGSSNSGKQLLFTLSGTNTYNIGGLKGSDDIDTGVNVISVGANGGNTSYNGVIHGTGAKTLTKVGTGTLTLTAPQSYTGATTVSKGTLALSGTGSIAGSGTLTVASGASFDGATAVAGSIVNNGTLSLGSSIGQIQAPGNYTQTGTLNLDLGGPVGGVGYDQLAVSGTATLGGTLNVNLVNGYVPVSGDAFTLVQSGTLAGTFGSVNLPALPAGLLWNISYANNSVVISVTTTP